MSRASEADAYDRARIKYEVQVESIERKKREVDKWTERNRDPFGRDVQINPPAHIRKAMEATSSYNPETAYDKVSKADKALGNRMKDEYSEMRRGGLPRELSDQIARTHNYKDNDDYYRNAARERVQSARNDIAS